MALIIYTFALFLVLALGLPYWLLAMATNGKYREGLSERLGWVPDRLREGDPRKTIWVHAVSVGEVLAASRLVNELSACAPQYRVLLSTTTRTGQRLARERTGANQTFYFPLDFPWIVRRYLRVLDPVLLVLVETELWPNLLTACRRAAIPVAVVNGRISDRSLPRYLCAPRHLEENTGGGLDRAGAERGGCEAHEGDWCTRGPGFLCRQPQVRRTQRRAGSNHHHPAREACARQPGYWCAAARSRAKKRSCSMPFSNCSKPFPDCVMILAPRHPERFGRVAQMLKNRNQSSGAPFQLDEASGKDKTRHRDSAGFDRRAGVGVCAGLGCLRWWEPGSGRRP